MAFIKFLRIRRHSAPKICRRHKILPRRPEIASRQAKMASRWIRKGLREAGDGPRGAAGDGPRGAGRLQEGLREISRSELRTNMARNTLPGPPRTLPDPPGICLGTRGQEDSKRTSKRSLRSKSELRTNIARKALRDHPGTLRSTRRRPHALASTRKWNLL